MGYEKPSKGLRAEDSAAGYKMDKRGPRKIETMGYPCDASTDTPAVKLGRNKAVPTAYKGVMPGYGEPKSRYY